jgi:hypothetical protein
VELPEERWEGEEAFPRKGSRVEVAQLRRSHWVAYRDYEGHTGVVEFLYHGSQDKLYAVRFPDGEIFGFFVDELRVVV